MGVHLGTGTGRGVARPSLGVGRAPSDRATGCRADRAGGIRHDQGKAGLGGAPRFLRPVPRSRREGCQGPDVCAKNEPIPWRKLLVDPKTKGVANGFAYIVKPKGSNPEAVKNLIEKNPRLELDQINCEYMPYVLALHQDQTLLIKSSDPKGHNVRFSAFNNGGFNQIVAANGQLEKKLVAERFPIVLKCDIHPWMKGI